MFSFIIGWFAPAGICLLFGDPVAEGGQVFRGKAADFLQESSPEGAHVGKPAGVADPGQSQVRVPHHHLIFLPTLSVLQVGALEQVESQVVGTDVEYVIA